MNSGSHYYAHTSTTLFCYYWQENEFDRGWSEAWETKLLASVSPAVFPALTKSIISLGIEWDPTHAEKWTANRKRPQMSLWRWTGSYPEQASLHHLTGGKCATSALIAWPQSLSPPSFLADLCFLSMYFWKHQSEDKTGVLTLAQYKKAVESFYPGYLVLVWAWVYYFVFSCQLLWHLVLWHRGTF